LKKIIFLFVLFISFSGFSQSTNLDREYFHYSVIDLPTHPISNPADRTFSVNDDYIAIAGFSRVGSDGTIQIDFMFNGTTVEDFIIKEIKHEKKDKKGDVISTRYTYNLDLDYISTGAVFIKNTLTGQDFNDRYSYNANYTKYGFKSRAKAQRYYDNNRRSLNKKYRNKHIREMEETIQNYLNRTYGYPINSGKDNFWILSRKSHPEYYKHHEAFEKARLAFVKMSYNSPTNQIERDLQPVIKYFKEVIPRYTGKKKKARKVRYASYYNLAKIYFYLDNMEKTREYGQKLIDNNYDKKDGKAFIRRANELQDLFYANGVNSRHFGTPNTEIHESENENPNENEENQSEENQTEEEEANMLVAYLITKANDTIQASISNASIDKINHQVSLKVTDGAGGFKDKDYQAKYCKALALTNGDVYQVVNFEEVNKNESTTDEKFAKVLFESDKITLYKYKEELVLKRPNEAKGISTASSSFIFGLNKKLAAYAPDCTNVTDKTNTKYYKNKEASLIEFCQDFSKCN
jgi:hypothetical protein